ncbi:Crp/Fnr family transcriptional regulator [Pedobacter rhizosphaerae]|uniref:cAMP-binding domain of CRP or a regulatory subunit of cAMP-dependent protein kinases n=1 Tax=Pedobacter rhizosphaerae TaxID=390241 RepID=A0A1H9VC18_9SPHI|nr:Crp/Fnr family transcriptional regulator [Pedobacter rhizosphaerae]SES18777.1 cAMP-binding domain of CRP or a regulatory subunit of cAMP-dependent protein kinases [Pedobacter rhizosphaerae]
MIRSLRNDAVNLLLKYLEKLQPLSEGFIKAVETNAVPLTVKKSKFILSPLEINESVFFVTKGIVRGFVKDEERDITTWISFGNEFIGAIHNPNLEAQPSIEYLQALEETELVEMSNELIHRLYAYYPETNIIGRKILAIQYYEASERSILARIPSAEGRFERFMLNSSHNLNLVPLRYIASYLGMRLETLSRIRNKAAREKSICMA